MNNLTKTIFLAAFIFFFNLGFVQAEQVITFHGVVISNTCETKINGITGPNVSIPVDGVLKKHLDAAGKTANHREFDIELYGCTALENGSYPMTLSISAEANHIETTAGGVNVLKNTLTGEATNVAFQLTKKDKTPINLTASNSYDIETFDVKKGEKGTVNAGKSEDARKYTLGVQYYATGAATIGKINSKVTLNAINK